MKELTSKHGNHYVHGLSSSRLHKIWRGIKERTLNVKCERYHRYGGRGITIAEEWKNDFMIFYKWAIDNGYNDNLVIDRKNNDGNYEPGNCRWINTNVSAENKRLLRSDNKTGYRGIVFNKKKNLKKPWRSQIRWNNITYRLGYYSIPEQAARAYNNFVITHKTNHPLNII